MFRRDGLVATVIPTNDTAQYAAGDVIGVPKQISNATIDTKGLAVLRTVVVVDKANQKSAIDLLFFDQDPGSVGANNAALDLSATQLAMLIGRVTIGSADYTTLKAATNAEATKLIEMLLPAIRNSKDFWVVAVSRGTPTYGASGDIYFKIMLERY